MNALPRTPDGAPGALPEADGLPARRLAHALRILAADAVEAARSGHPGMPMGMADIATVLYARHLRFDPTQPHWPDRDRVVLSAGHGSMLLYALNHLTGYEKLSLDELRRFRQLGSHTPGHPEVDLAAGIETTTGPLGQGIATAVGMALGEAMLRAQFGQELVDHYTYVLASDGDLMEGVSHESCSLAGHLKLNRLIVLFDDNQISIDGPTDLSVSDDVPRRFEAYGWAVRAIDGHDPAAIDAALAWAKTCDRPVMIACRTVIGFGSPARQGTSEAHSNHFGPEELQAIRTTLGWSHAPFELPDDVRDGWRKIGQRGRAVRAAWEERLARHGQKDAFTARLAPHLPEAALAALAALKARYAAEPTKLATRQASGAVLDALAPVTPALVGGSADLTPSNNTKAKPMQPVKPGQFGGGYIHFGVREHGMAAALNGLALHGGFVPYGGTFLTFADYARPAIRLSALMGQRVVYVMTHDSIGLGEDGPTHQPVEHLAALRAIPNLAVFRPADALETVECWEAALARTDGPSLLALTRQALPGLRQDTATNQTLRGGYVLRAASAPRKATLIASGSEVSLAAEAQTKLEAAGVPTALVSLPCRELFLAQDAAYRAEVLGPDAAVRVGIEAAIELGWGSLLRPQDGFVGMVGFGASAPYLKLYEHFGITADAIVQAVQTRL